MIEYSNKGPEGVNLTEILHDWDWDFAKFLTGKWD